MHYHRHVNPRGSGLDSGQLPNDCQMNDNNQIQPNTIPKTGADSKLQFEGIPHEVTVLAGPQPAGPSTSPSRTLEPETVSESSLSRPWNVVVWNDPITLMNYVVYVFQKLFGFSREKATQLMLEVHQKGRSIVATVDREKAEYYVSRLHGFGLQSSLEQTE